MSYSVYTQAAIDALAGITPNTDLVPYYTSGTAAGTFASTAFGRGLVGDANAAAGRTSLGVIIGTDVQAFGAVLDDLNTLGAPTADGEFLVATAAGVFAYETGDTARTSMGVGTADDVTFKSVSAESLVSSDVNFGVVNAGEGIQNKVNYVTTTPVAVNLVGGTYSPTATNDTVNGVYTKGVAATSNPTVVTTGSATFSAADIVSINTGLNAAIYEVQGHVGTTLTIKGVGTTATTDAFFRGQWVDTGNDGATITKVAIAIARFSSTGVLQVATGSTTPLVFASPPDATQLWTDATGTVGVPGQAAPLYYLCDGTGGAVTMNLPDPETDGQEVTFKVFNAANATTINRGGASTIDGQNSLVLDTLYQSATLKYDSGKDLWAII